jgi:chromatin remodeling complex protein RSC6
MAGLMEMLPNCFPISFRNGIFKYSTFFAEALLAFLHKKLKSRPQITEDIYKYVNVKQEHEINVLLNHTYLEIEQHVK